MTDDCGASYDGAKKACGPTPERIDAAASKALEACIGALALIRRRPLDALLRAHGSSAGAAVAASSTMS